MAKQILYILCLGAFLSSCRFFHKKEETPTTSDPQKKVIARVFDSYLYEEDLKGLLIEEHTHEDSIKLVKGYINSWVKKQVLLKKAEKNIQGSLEEVDMKVEKYRYDLILYEYQRKYLEERLNKTVTEKDIETYYADNMSDFELKQNIVKCHFIRLNKNVPKVSKMIDLFKSTKARDQKKFKEFVLQYSDSYSMDDDIWYDFNDVVSQTPFATYQNQVQFLKKNKIAQESDENNIFLLKVLEYKISDQISPLEFVKERIRSIVINKRKVELLKSLEQGVYDQANENGDFEIY